MNKKMISVLYGLVLLMMTAAAYLVAADILLPGNGFLAGVLAAAAVTAIIADMKLQYAGKKRACKRISLLIQFHGFKYLIHGTPLYLSDVVYYNLEQRNNKKADPPVRQAGVFVCGKRKVA